MSDIVIAGALRTAIGKSGGTLASAAAPGPVPASRRRLAKAGRKATDLDPISINEAFAARLASLCIGVALAVAR